MREEKASSPIGVGVLTILTVLLVLALAVFSVLTFTSAKADLALSRTNAETVSAYYAADAQAKARMADFMAGTAPEYEETIPMTDAQSLHIHLRRQTDGTCAVLAWNTVANERETEFDQGLDVWDGTLPA